VTIYDMGAVDSRRIIYADSGQMGFTDQGTNLQMQLYHGSVHAFKQNDPSLFQATNFVTNVILVRDVSNRLDLEARDGVRGDREMGTCEMMGVVLGAQREAQLAEQRRRSAADRDLRSLLGLGPWAEASKIPLSKLPGYCTVLTQLRRKLGTAQPDTSAQLATREMGPRDRPFVTPPQKPPAPPSPRPGDSPRAVPITAVPAPPTVPAGERRPRQLTTWGEVSAARDEIRSSSARAHQYLVEVHKKWAISVACLVFALVGIPMALRFPRGGMGLVIGGGLFVFAIYYVGLIAGEGLGNKDIVHPWMAMWAPNIIFAVLGLLGILRVSRESGSTRGGDLAELWDTLTSRFRRQKGA
jgi:lipopolysaccharide export system permease protein